MPFKDLMQETLLIAYAKFETLRDKNKFLFFLFGIATRILWNDDKKVKPVSLAELSESQEAVWPDPDRRSDTEQLYKALAQLSAEQEETILLFEIVGFSVREIAAYQQKNEEAVRQQLVRGRQKLVLLLSKNQVSKSTQP